MTDWISILLGPWSAGDGALAIGFRLLLALTFGAVIGCERAAKRHAAGLRTFVLVCMSGTAAMTLDRAAGSLPVISAAVVLGIVLQDVNLFTGTVMENIRYGKLDATDEECIAAAKLSNAHDFITRLPEGYNTMLTANGANLSQGQRQRRCDGRTQGRCLCLRPFVGVN